MAENLKVVHKKEHFIEKYNTAACMNENHHVA
jgi:hypothetical protein